LKKTYIYADGWILAQHDGDYAASRYFYLHDRLGSVRQIVDSSGEVANCYYYTPWGGLTGSETEETVSNWYGWAGYLSDEEIDSYYCNVRQYNAARFMTRDPVRGQRPGQQNRPNWGISWLPVWTGLGSTYEGIKLCHGR